MHETRLRELGRVRAVDRVLSSRSLILLAEVV